MLASDKVNDNVRFAVLREVNGKYLIGKIAIESRILIELFVSASLALRNQAVLNTILSILCH